MEKEELDFEKLKLVFDKVAENYRYYLSWRRYILAGSFAVTYTLFYSSCVLFEKGEYYLLLAAILLCINGLASKFFLRLEKRNTVLYQVCQRVGSRIEQLLFSQLKSDSQDYKDCFLFKDRSPDNIALFYSLDNSYKHPPKPNSEDENTHSGSLNRYYDYNYYTSLGCSGLLLLLLIVRLFSPSA